MRVAIEAALHDDFGGPDGQLGHVAPKVGDRLTLGRFDVASGAFAELAIGAAEVIVQRSLDRDTQTRLVDNYIEQVSSRSN